MDNRNQELDWTDWIYLTSFWFPILKGPKKGMSCVNKHRSNHLPVEQILTFFLWSKNRSDGEWFIRFIRKRFTLKALFTALWLNPVHVAACCYNIFQVNLAKILNLINLSPIYSQFVPDIPFLSGVKQICGSSTHLIFTSQGLPTLFSEK